MRSGLALGVFIFLSLFSSPSFADWSWPAVVLACSKTNSDFIVRTGRIGQDDKPGEESVDPVLPETEALWSTLTPSKSGTCVLPSGIKVSAVLEHEGEELLSTMVTVRYGKTKFYYGYINDEGYHGSFDRIAAIVFKGGKLFECGYQEQSVLGPCVEQPQRVKGELTKQELDRLAVDHEKARLSKAVSAECKVYGQGDWEQESKSISFEMIDDACRVLGESVTLFKSRFDINNDGEPDLVYSAEGETHYMWGAVLIAFLDGDRHSAEFQREFDKRECDVETLSELLAAHPEWNAVLVGSGPSGASLRYTFNRPSFFGDKVFIRTFDPMISHVPTKALREMTKAGEIRNVCLYP